jgi:hypothetical protein
MPDSPPTPFAGTVAELAALGVTLRARPGEYEVNFAAGDATTAYVTDDLADAIDHGRALARSIDRPQQATARPARAGRRRRPPPRTAKAYNRRLRKQHMRRLRARALRQQRTDRHDDNA